MPIDVEKAMSAPISPMEFEYDQDKVILYALGVGAGVPSTDKDELKFTYESGLKALPTFGVVPPFASLMKTVGHPGLKFNPMLLLHGEQYLEIRKTPIPVKAKTINKPAIKAIYDKGKGAALLLECVTENEKGEELFYNVFTLFLRGEGGFGGDSGPKVEFALPDRAPDKSVSLKTLPQQAILYRLSGDKNPLHIDPGFATIGGFEKPILHGLCTFGHVGRAVLLAFCGNDPAKFKSINVRFASHVFPGETIVTEMWQTAPDTILLKAKTAERGLDVITNATVKLNV
ncbi:MAG TPA: MaoC/PaaZ C-terminal domain-containing protein [bacterium]|nr:MAG: MaoC like domain protein [bacterium ADurb.Bin236]HOC91413.1 MaoC/PaaZ C-terminal domain-containing protein [bacterium]HPN95286.1 MaoC/PaaZ C-terminal domain-containing protein [bacterium]